MYNYYDYSCLWTHEFGPSVSFGAVAWRTDILLPQPQLYYPRADAVLCPETTAGAGSNIFLKWSGIAGATHYLVQWGGNQSLSGPNVREALVVATNQYELITDTDIQVGETIYWRVQAQNRTTGGVSALSEVRKLQLDCGEKNIDSGFDRCSAYDVQMKISGDNFMSCCDEQVFWLEMSFSCKDRFERELITVSDVEWSVDTDPNASAPAFVKPTAKFENDYKTIVETCGLEGESQMVRLTATVTFTDNVVGDTFECEVSRTIFVDCDTPYHQRPWAFGDKAGNYCYPICLGYQYQDTYPYGMLYNPNLDYLLDAPYTPGYFDKFAVATGPVFKVPICNGIYTYCCECVPEVLKLTVAGHGYTFLRHDLDTAIDPPLAAWPSDPGRGAPFYGCPDAIWGSLICASDPAWEGTWGTGWHVFLGISCGDCIDTGFCGCIPKEFTLNLDWVEVGPGGDSGTIAVKFEHEFGLSWLGSPVPYRSPTFTPPRLRSSYCFYVVEF